MVVWPVLIVHALLCKWRWPLTGTIVLIFLLTTALYASTWITHPAHDNPAETLFHPLGLLKYMATFLFAPLTRVMHLPLGWFGNQTQIAGGLCLLAVFVFGAFRNYLIPKAEYGRGRFSVMVGAFCIGIAFITALGRLTINAGVDSRYLIVPIMFLITLPGTIWFDHKHNSVPKNACLVLYFYLLIGTAISSLFTYRNDIEHRRAGLASLSARAKCDRPKNALFMAWKAIWHRFWFVRFLPRPDRDSQTGRGASGHLFNGGLVQIWRLWGNAC